MFQYTGKDKTFKKIHNTLNKIEWIMENKKPYPTDSDPVNKSFFDELLESYKNGKNPFGI